MKMKTLILAACMCMASSIPAVAAGPYVGFGGGLSLNHDSDLEISGYSGSADVEYDPGYGFNVVGGYDFNPIRLEAEFAYRNADVDEVKNSSISDTEVSTMSYMINAYYDVKTLNSLIKPYIGVGMGLINGELEVDGYDEDDTTFGYQFTAGATTAVAKNVNLDLYYRFQGAPSDFEKDGVELSYNNSSFFVGFRFGF